MQESIPRFPLHIHTRLYAVKVLVTIDYGLKRSQSGGRRVPEIPLRPLPYRNCLPVSSARRAVPLSYLRPENDGAVGRTPINAPSTLTRRLQEERPITKPSAPAGELYHSYLLAGRGQRLLARIAEGVLKGLVSALTIIPAFLLFPDERGFILISFLYVGTAVGFWAMQAYLLTVRAQSIGKMMVGIKIIRRNDGSNGGFVWNFLIRELLTWLLCAIPFYYFVDVVFIFSEDRRCIHDHLAGTIVVREYPEPLAPAASTSPGEAATG